MDKFYKKEQVVTADGELVETDVKSFYNPFQEGRGYNFKYKSAYTKTYTEIELPKEFTDSECGKLYRLSKKIYSNSNLLARRSNSEIVPLSMQDIIEQVGVHRSNFYPFWGKVEKYRIIKLIDIGGMKFYCFNPLFFNATQYMPLYVYEAFKEELKDEMPEWVHERYAELKKGGGVFQRQETKKEAENERNNNSKK